MQDFQKARLEKESRNPSLAGNLRGQAMRMLKNFDEQKYWIWLNEVRHCPPTPFWLI